MFDAKEHLPEIHGVKDSPPCWVEEPWTITSLGSPNRSNTRGGRTTDARGWNVGPCGTEGFKTLPDLLCPDSHYDLVPPIGQFILWFTHIPSQKKQVTSGLGPKKITPRPRRLLGHGDALLHLDLISCAIKDLIGSLCTTGIVLATWSSGPGVSRKMLDLDRFGSKKESPPQKIAIEIIEMLSININIIYIYIS